jgi:hypothetical protein
MNQKQYIGNGKKKKDNWRKASICLDDLIKYVQDRAVQPANNGKTYINIDINDKQPDQWGNDLSISIDTYREDTRNAI